MLFVKKIDRFFRIGLVRLIKKWPLCFCALLSFVVLACVGTCALGPKDSLGVKVVEIAGGVLSLPGIAACICAPARLFVGVCRKTLAYDTHADAALLVLVECFLSLLAGLHM